MATKPGPLDELTYARTHATLSKARVRGHDPAEELNRLGLLLTPAQDRRIRLEAMGYLHEQMIEWSPAEFLRRKHRNLNVCTIQDLYTCIHEWIQDQINYVKEEK